MVLNQTLGKDFCSYYLSLLNEKAKKTQVHIAKTNVARPGRQSGQTFLDNRRDFFLVAQATGDAGDSIF
ncbi:hypothetical protein GCM10011511_31200 [Puia dinghuensis]|uniref:Uncharacterized protein n=1 Tax=Puia dinghuensis TaxID=1792502 RepID=A0A8J2UEL4_9BACT|nr:hypothetical protein GCM10011511_31200 [Puia dinghuensis]